MVVMYADAAQNRHGWPRDLLILNGSHTHSGPALTGEELLRPAEDINAEQEAVIRRYATRVLDQIVELIGQAIQDLAPAELAFAQGSARFGVNRRRVGRGMRHLPGPVDQDVPARPVRRAGGARVRAGFLWLRRPPAARRPRHAPPAGTGGPGCPGADGPWRRRRAPRGRVRLRLPRDVRPRGLPDRRRLARARAGRDRTVE